MYKSKNADLPWLKGKWYSEEWKVTYQFSKENGQWAIRDQDNFVSEKLTVKGKSDKEFDLVESDGTTYHIEKINDKEIYFQQIAAEGREGTTASVKFVKKK